MFSAHQGEIVGGLAVLTGEPSFYTIRAKHPSRIALLSKPTFFAIMRDQPTVVLHVAHTVVRRLSPFVRQVRIFTKINFYKKTNIYIKQAIISYIGGFCSRLVVS